MIRIVKGTMKQTVTKSAYENFFAAHGWELDDKKSAPKVEVAKEVHGQETQPEQPTIEPKVDGAEPESEDDTDGEWDGVDEDEPEDDGVTKPLSEMNREELEEYAASLDVDIKGLTKNAQIRAAIKKSLTS